MTQVTVSPLSAVIMKDMDLIGKMDPYVSVTVGTVTQKTKVVENGGKTPRWGDQLTFNCNSNDIVQMRLYDDDIGADDFIGEVRVPVQDIITCNGNLTNTYPFTSAKNSGTLTVRLQTSGHQFTNYQQTFPTTTTTNTNTFQSSNYIIPAATTSFANPVTSQTQIQYVQPQYQTAFVQQVPSYTQIQAFNVPQPSRFGPTTNSPYASGYGLAPYGGAAPGSTVYTPNPYLANPKDNKPFCGCL